jgi:hypothetical protein
MLLASSRSESLRRRGVWKRRRSVGGPGKSGSVNWNLLISDTVAHLLNASGNIDELMKGGLNQTDSLVSMELASQSVWAVLVSLEQCSRELLFIPAPGNSDGHQECDSAGNCERSVP